MKKLAIIGANDFQRQLILKAKECGYETHVFAWEDGAVGKKDADFFYPISIVEKDEILEKCQKIGINGICSIASDLAAITVNYIAEKMGLIGNGIESSLIATNKYLMRKAFAANCDPSPRNYRSDELNDAVIDSLTLPLIVKPVDRSGSRGITKITDKNQLAEAIKIAEDLSFDKKAMIEEFIEGKEYSVEYVSYRGTHSFLALTEKFTTGAPHFIETGHIQPAYVTPEILDKVKLVVSHALDSLKIKNGASHSEIKINSDGSIKIVEIGGRMGGDCIGSDLVRISTGYDFVRMVIDIALGNKPDFTKVCTPKKAEVRFIFSKNDLIILEQEKKNNPEKIYRISDIEEISDEHKVEDSSTRYGYYILAG